MGSDSVIQTGYELRGKGRRLEGQSPSPAVQGPLAKQVQQTPAQLLALKLGYYTRYTGQQLIDINYHTCVV